MSTGPLDVGAKENGPRSSVGRWTHGWAVLVALLGVEICATGADLLLGPWSQVHPEERFNARAALQILCGHLDHLWAFQYRPYCGGCTLESLMAAPLFAWLEPTVLVWKIVPALFHLGLLGAGAWFLMRASSARAAILFLALMMGAPGFYRQVSLTGWGNHAESTLFPLVAALLLTFLAVQEGRVARAGFSFLTGVVSGFGLWFCYTSGYGLPAVLIAGAWTWRWSGLFIVPGALLGFLPWFLYRWWHPTGFDETLQFISGGGALAPMSELANWLGGRFVRESLWPEGQYGVMGWIPFVWWAGLWACAWVGTVISFSAGWGGKLRKPVMFGALALVGLIASYAFTYDVWSEFPEDYDFAWFHLRHRTPLYPLLALCAVLCIELPWRVLSRSFGVLVMGLALFGVWQRVSQWDQLRTTVMDLRIYEPDWTSDPTVDGSDVSAALAHVLSHQDRYPECRDHHVAELGVRLGATWGDVGDVQLDAWLRAIPADVALLDRRALVDGFAYGLLGQERQLYPGLTDDLAHLDELQPGLGREVGEAIGRQTFFRFSPEEDPVYASSPEPGLWSGVCARRGFSEAEARSLWGTLRPSPVFDPVTRETGAGRCFSNEAYWRGLGRGWARYVGCDRAARAQLMIDVRGHEGPALEGYLSGCKEFRSGG